MRKVERDKCVRGADRGQTSEDVELSADELITLAAQEAAALLKERTLAFLEAVGRAGLAGGC